MHRTIFMALLLGAGCTGDDGKTDADTAADTDTGTAPTYPATWEGVQQLFAAHCNSCHPSENQIDLVVLISDDLTTGYNAYVTPGSADDSFLWLLVSGQYLLQMPPETEGGLLPSETVAAIRDWIDAGALLE